MKYFKFFIVFMLMAIVAVFTAGCWHETEIIVHTPENELESEKETMRVKLYFPDKEAMHLLVEERDVAKTKTPAEVAIEELIKGPVRSDCLTIIPKGTKLLGIEVKEKVAHIDFNGDFAANYRLGSAAENMMVYSIVNTLTEFSNIEFVRFLSEGKPLNVVGSNFDFEAQEFSRNEDIIKK